MAVIKAETLDAETREALIEKAETLRMRLGLEDPIVATIEQASTQLGLQAELRGLSPVDKANACLSHLGFQVREPQQYLLEPSHMDWHAHDRKARSLGYTLAPITSVAELGAVVHAAAGQTVWIGAVRHGRGNGTTANYWQWSSGED